MKGWKIMGEIKKIVTENEESKRIIERLEEENKDLRRENIELKARIETLLSIELELRRALAKSTPSQSSRSYLM